MSDLFSHLIELKHMNSYVAPKTRIRPPLVQTGLEIVEIIIDGRVRYQGKDYGRGTILWHIAGEKLIGELSLEDEPYSCFAFFYRVSKRVRTAPHISFWPDDFPMDYDSFFLEAERLFYDPEVNRDFLSQYLYAQCFRIARYGKKQDSPQNFSSAMSRVLRCLRYCGKPDISVPELARMNQISVSGLFALFRKELHTSPHTFILKKRINHAKVLLCWSKANPLKEVARRCGFKSLETFSRAFKRLQAMTPGEYRRRHHHDTDNILELEDSSCEKKETEF